LATVLPLNATVDGLADALADALAGSEATTAGAVGAVAPAVAAVGPAAGATYPAPAETVGDAAVVAALGDSDGDVGGGALITGSSSPISVGTLPL
jgi:hypothetical protein